MYEIDFLAVGEGERSGDAIALRYTIPGRSEPVVGIIDAGFKANGEELVEDVPRWYGTKTIDFALLTHPDLDHVGGMGQVVRGLDVRCLLVHRPALHGYGSNSGAEPAEELAALVEEKHGQVVEPFAGVSGWDRCAVYGPSVALGGAQHRRRRVVVALDCASLARSVGDPASPSTGRRRLRTSQIARRYWAYGPISKLLGRFRPLTVNNHDDRHEATTGRACAGRRACLAPS